jgi:hypothetical protein
VPGTATLGLFKPFMPDRVTFPVVGPACYADCDQSGARNVNDFVCFLNRFAGGDQYADCAYDFTLNVNDLVCFQREFAQGCQ